MTIFAHRLRSILLSFLLLFVLWFAAGCPAVQLRDAQDNFNKGAEIELKALDRSLLSDNPDANPGDAFAALNEYRLAHALAQQLIEKKAVELRQDNLLGATYILNALALWRISDLEGNSTVEGETAGATGAEEKEKENPAATTRQQLLAALNQIQIAKDNNQIALGTRDKVLHKALYGYYDHDGGRAEKNYAKAREWFASAIDRLKESLDGDVPPQHPIRVYVGSAQLRTLAAWELSNFIERENIAGASKEKSCNSNPNSIDCLALKKQREVIEGDEKTIIEETENLICELKPFWEKNSTVKDSISNLLAPIGLITINPDKCP